MTDITIPSWYREIQDHVATNQSEIFLLHGDTLGYPLLPQQNLPSFLRAVTASSHQEHVFAVLSPASGLVMDEKHQETFDRVSPPPKSTSFASGGMTQNFQRIHSYFRNMGKNVPPMTLVIMDSDLLFDSDAPMVEPEKTLISYVRQWASRPLLTANSEAHTVFMVSQSQVGIRSAMLQGRVTQVKIPMPDKATRHGFIVNVLDKVGHSIEMEDGLDLGALARITGALNLLQIEDVIYQAVLKNGILTRKMVNDRKDELIRTTYGGVVQISYPDEETEGFDTIVGYESVKRYVREFVYPLLIDGDKGCPKGCCLAGAPGCLGADTPIYDPIYRSLKTVKDRYDEGVPFYVYSLNEETGKLCIAQADRPYKYNPTHMYKVTTKRGHSIKVTGGHRIWTGHSYETVSSFLNELHECDCVPLDSTLDTSLLGSHASDHRLRRKAEDFPVDHLMDHHFYDEQPQTEKVFCQEFLPPQHGSYIYTHLRERLDDLASEEEHACPPSFDLHSTRDFEFRFELLIGSESVHLPCSKHLLPASYWFSIPEPSLLNFQIDDRYPQAFEVLSQPTCEALSHADEALSHTTLETLTKQGRHQIEKFQTSLQFAFESYQTKPIEEFHRQVEAFGSKPSHRTCLDHDQAYEPPPLLRGDCIVSIQCVGVEPYYDFHVPEHENYWACGMVHHNTGKSKFPRALAASVKMPLVTVQMDQIKNKYVGESQKNMAKLQEGILAMAPVIVFIDEVDKIMPAGDDNTGVNQEILGQFQTFVSDMPRGMGFFVATTNYPERIPRALLRPGRFEEVIPMLPQHLDGLRGKALSIIIKQLGLSTEGEIHWDSIGEEADGYTGADLNSLLIKAHKVAVMAGRKKIQQDDLQQAVEDIVPTVAGTQEMVDSALRYCSDKSYVPASMREKVGASSVTDEIPERRIAR